MSHSDATDPSHPPMRIMAAWADVLIRDAQARLDRMDTTLTLTEARIALARRQVERRRLLETGR